MKLQFKIQLYQTRAVEAVARCFAGQPKIEKQSYRLDPGKEQRQASFELSDGFRNADIALNKEQILANLQQIQSDNGIFPRSEKLDVDVIKFLPKPDSEKKETAHLFPNLDIEMETGTGKTYCYIKTAFELNKLYGWSKFIVIVPSIAIREGVKKTLEITADHFMESYGKKARFFIYDSSRLSELESFSSDSGIQIMVMNIQAFNARGKDNLRIYNELDDFQSRRPIEVIARNRPILIIDEPQKQEGEATREALPKFNPLMALRYSATHKTKRDCVYRLDAVEAYNQHLVKKIAVRGIEITSIGGISAYLYLEGIDISPSAPVVRLGFEQKLKSGGTKWVVQKCRAGDDIFVKSKDLEQYKHGFTIAGIDANKNIVEFANGIVLKVGQAIGNGAEKDMRRIQIRETIRAHFDKERQLFAQNIKVLSLFFIDEVVKYRDYTQEDNKGEYARIFEEEYQAIKEEFMAETLLEPEYRAYLERDSAAKVHDGYFSIDKKGHMTDPKVKKRGDNESDDSSAYDLILKDKERLLSRQEPVRFIFSHSALREGWDNPNVFTLCMLKGSAGNDVSRRQEIGRGLRLCVNDKGERQDAPETVHEINVLTVIANESYESFAGELQKEIAESLGARAVKMTADFFSGQMVRNAAGEKVKIDEHAARAVERWLIENKYTDENDTLSDTYRNAAKAEEIAPLPAELESLKPGLLALLNKAAQNEIEIIDKAKEQKAKRNAANFERQEFKALWARINRKAVYRVDYDTERLIADSIASIDRNLRVEQPQITIRGGEIKAINRDELEGGSVFAAEKSRTQQGHLSAGTVKYDLLGEVAKAAHITRHSAARILSKIQPGVFAQFKGNPESFIAGAAKLILNAKIKLVVERLKKHENSLAYQPLEEQYEANIFASELKFYERRFVADTPRKNIYDKALLDSQTEMDFAKALEGAEEVAVYTKLPRGFTIPTPIGGYNPDWAIAFNKNKVRHIYFIAETKSTDNAEDPDLRAREQSKIECAKRYFENLYPEDCAQKVHYGVVQIKLLRRRGRCALWCKAEDSFPTVRVVSHGKQSCPFFRRHYPRNYR